MSMEELEAELKEATRELNRSTFRLNRYKQAEAWGLIRGRRRLRHYRPERWI